MKNFFRKKLNTEEEKELETWLTNFYTNTAFKIKPKEELLNKILNKIEIKDVTNYDLVRNTTKEKSRVFKINPFLSFIENMNKFIKILSGTAVVSALVLVLILSYNRKEKIETPTDVSKNTEITVDGESLDIDSLVADLVATDSLYEESVVDDSDILLDLVNANDYEIQ